ncbi:GNAT family N-acetyltransferase [Paenibacillus sp. CN-4]|uniref:GNAT family N-acetyltransferase n=1 Tax=Paenibacillus nanchangensis TaxID=3348343 RepID=UPI00397E1043
MYTIHQVTEDPTHSLDRIRNELYGFNQKKVSEATYQPLNFLVRDQNEVAIGGILGHRFGDGVFVEILWVEESHRGQGIGQSLLQRLEQEARAEGGKTIHLDTQDFQAPQFYLRNGYEVFGTLENVPLPGNTRYYMKKEL